MRASQNNFGITMFCCACDRLGVPRPVACENEYSLVNRTYESNAWEAAYRFGLAGLPYGVLSGGVLTGKCDAPSPVPRFPPALSYPGNSVVQHAPAPSMYPRASRGSRVH